jgi:ABC-type Zn uptake system ZnuABC Zn-binding protein ZnuA
MTNADALIVNGAGLEEGLLDVIESAEAAGVPTFEAISAVQTIEFGEGGHDDHGDEQHSDDEHSDDEKDEEHSDEHGDDEHSDDEHSGEEHSDDEKDEDHSDEDHSDDEEHSDEDHSDEHGDDHGHDHSGVDPHFWLDPMQMAAAVDGIVVFVQSEVAFGDPASLEASAAAYIAELEALDVASAAQFEAIPEGNRVLVTNHDNLGYFAAHYGFEAAGAVIPSLSTLESADAGELAELAELIEAEGVPAIFADNSASDELAQVLADEVGGVEVVELYTGSLGEPGSDGATYLLMMSANAERISSSLA